MAAPLTVDGPITPSSSGSGGNHNFTKFHDNISVTAITMFYGNETFTNGTTEISEVPKHFSEFTEYTIAEFVNRYYLYAVCAIGIPGNVACILTLVYMRPMVSSAVYMMVLAVVDIVAIALKLFYFQMTLNDIKLGDRTCQMVFLFGTVSQQYSNWILVAMTLERFVAIWFPFKVKTFCSKRNAVFVISAMLLFFILANLQFVFTFEEVKDSYLVWDCRPKHKYSDFFQYVWYWLDGTLYAVLPIILIIVFNVLIVVAVRKSARSQRSLTNRGQNLSEQTGQQRQITIMLLTISIVFVLLILPNCIFFIVREYWTWRETMQGIAQYFLVYQVVFLLSDLNHAVNFYFYCLSGRKFRERFITIICFCRTNPQNNGYATNSSVSKVVRSQTSTSAMTSLSTLSSSISSSENTTQDSVQISGRHI